MVGHDYKFMEQIFCLTAVVEQNIDKKAGHSVRLKNVPLLKSAAVTK
jgi:hypothetical protein